MRCMLLRTEGTKATVFTNNRACLPASASRESGIAFRLSVLHTLAEPVKGSASVQTTLETLYVAELAT